MESRFVWLTIFYLMQIGAYVLFKFGSTSDSRWLPCFVGGSIIGASSMWILMKLYSVMNVNVATGLAVGGGFLCSQIALALIFRTGISGTQYFGILMISCGLFVLARG